MIFVCTILAELFEKSFLVFNRRCMTPRNTNLLSLGQDRTKGKRGCQTSKLKKKVLCSTIFFPNHRIPFKEVLTSNRHPEKVGFQNQCHDILQVIRKYRAGLTTTWAVSTSSVNLRWITPPFIFKRLFADCSMHMSFQVPEMNSSRRLIVK